MDLNLFEFDYDLTMMIFFMDAEEKLYGRYGQRDADGPDRLQSLEGLRHTMTSVLQMHQRQEKHFAARSPEAARAVRGPGGVAGLGRGCLHCHQVKERINADLLRSGKWDREMAWRYPLPENVGLLLEIDRGNVVKEILEKSAASALGMKPGDVVTRLGGVPVHSMADAQLALDRAPKTGALEVVWQRGDKVLEDKLVLAEGWKKTDLSWRPSMQRLVPSARLYGNDLTTEEKKASGSGRSSSRSASATWCRPRLRRPASRRATSSWASMTGPWRRTSMASSTTSAVIT